MEPGKGWVGTKWEQPWVHPGRGIENVETLCTTGQAFPDTFPGGPASKQWEIEDFETYPLPSQALLL